MRVYTAGTSPATRMHRQWDTWALGSNEYYKEGIWSQGHGLSWKKYRGRLRWVRGRLVGTVGEALSYTRRPVLVRTGYRRARRPTTLCAGSTAWCLQRNAKRHKQPRWRYPGRDY